MHILGVSSSRSNWVVTETKGSQCGYQYLKPEQFLCALSVLSKMQNPEPSNLHLLCQCAITQQLTGGHMRSLGDALLAFRASSVSP